MQEAEAQARVFLRDIRIKDQFDQYHANIMDAFKSMEFMVP